MKDFTACIKAVFVRHPQVHEHHLIILVALLIQAMTILVLDELLNSYISIASLINIKMNFLLPQIACETILLILVLNLVIHRLVQTIEVDIDICQHLLEDH